MANKKKQVEVISDPPTRDLEPTLVVGGQPYNIHAVTAGKVVNNITIESAKETITFDGSEAKTIRVMSPDGGDFNGNITVPEHTEDFTNNDVLNYTEIKDIVLNQLINNSILYNWDNDELTPSIGENQLNSISIIQGSGTVFDFAQKNYENKYLSAYIFLNTTNLGNKEETQIYFGTSGLVTPIPLVTGESGYAANAGRAETADKLSTPSYIKTELGYSEAVAFDGSKGKKQEDPALIGVSGTLGVANGGTGQNDLGKVTVGKAKVVSDGNYTKTAAEIYTMATDIDNNAKSISDNATEIAKIKNGNTTVAKATNATSATSANSASVADKIGIEIIDSSGNTTKSGYTTNKVRISPNAPTAATGSDGDIWIQYS